MNFGRINQYILFGGGQLLAEFALRLKQNRFSVVVVTGERHLKEFVGTSKNIILKDFLTDNNIEFIISEDINTDNDVINKITKQTLGISIGAPWIFKPKFIEYFEGKLINLHGARLPQDRGGGGFSWRILRNERLGVCLIHQIDAGVDTGNIIKYKEFFYPQSCRIPIDYQNYSTSKYYILLDEFIKEIETGKELETIKQQEYFSTYWPRLYTNIHGYIDWTWKLKEIERFICAFDDPYKGTITFLNSNKVRFKKCLFITNDGIFHPFQKGMVYKIRKGVLFIAGEDGSLIIESIKDESNVDIIDKVKVGDRFYTPMKYLETAKQYRAVYTSKGLEK